jgi:Flp pilus assembly protein TadD
VEEYPTDAYARLALGMALYRNGRHREAREAIRLAVDYRTPQPDPWDLFALAMVESKLGNAAEARNLYDRGVARLHETYPRFPDYLMMRDEAAEALGIQP